MATGASEPLIEHDSSSPTYHWRKASPRTIFPIEPSRKTFPPVPVFGSFVGTFSRSLPGTSPSIASVAYADTVDTPAGWAVFCPCQNHSKGSDKNLICGGTWRFVHGAGETLCPALGSGYQTDECLGWRSFCVISSLGDGYVKLFTPSQKLEY